MQWYHTSHDSWIVAYSTWVTAIYYLPLWLDLPSLCSVQKVFFPTDADSVRFAEIMADKKKKRSPSRVSLIDNEQVVCVVSCDLSVNSAGLWTPGQYRQFGCVLFGKVSVYMWTNGVRFYMFGSDQHTEEWLCLLLEYSLWGCPFGCVCMHMYIVWINCCVTTRMYSIFAEVSK